MSQNEGLLKAQDILLQGFFLILGLKECLVKKFGWQERGQLFFIGTKHEAFKHFYFHPTSIVIDPFRYLEEKESVKYIPIGKNT